MKRAPYSVWKGHKQQRWFIMNTNDDPGIDLLLHAQNYRAFDTFEELQDFLNNPGHRKCYL